MSNLTENSYIFSISELVDFVNQYEQENSPFSKEAIVVAVKDRFVLAQKRSVYCNNNFAIRFSTASGSSFSNTVLGLATLKCYDQIPFIVCVIRPNNIELLLANSIFLRKISHSSQQLRLNNVRGSFLGHDILREYEGITNAPPNFEKLFLIHKEFTWEENLLRLVEATNNIVPSGSRYMPTSQEQHNILASVEVANALSSDSEYLSLGITLNQLVLENKAAILEAGEIDNKMYVAIESSKLLRVQAIFTVSRI